MAEYIIYIRCIYIYIYIIVPVAITNAVLSRHHEKTDLIYDLPRSFYITWGVALLDPKENMGKYVQYMAIYGHVWPYIDLLINYEFIDN